MRLPIYGLMGLFTLVCLAQACIHKSPDLETAPGREATSASGCVAFVQESSAESGVASRLVIQVDGVTVASVRLIGLDRVQDTITYELALGKDSRLEEWDLQPGSGTGLLSTKRLVSRRLSVISARSDHVSQEGFVGYTFISNPKCDLWLYLPASSESLWTLSKMVEGRYLLVRAIDPALRKAICTIYDRMSPGASPVIAPEQLMIYFCTSKDTGFRLLAFPWPSLEPMNYPHCDKAQLPETSSEAR